MLKRILCSALLFAFLVSLVSCGGDGAPVLSHCELRLQLPEGYASVDSDSYDAVYSNGDYMIALTRISFVAGTLEGIPETMTESEFADFYLEKCSREANVISDGVTYAEYYEPSGGTEHFYLEAFYRSPYAYFVILFASDVSREAEARGVFLDLAEKVYFTN